MNKERILADLRMALDRLDDVKATPMLCLNNGIAVIARLIREIEAEPAPVEADPASPGEGFSLSALKATLPPGAKATLILEIRKD